jgi:hypothetical protein
LKHDDRHAEVHWTGGYGARFPGFSLVENSSAKITFSCPSRQPVTQTVGPP